MRIDGDTFAGFNSAPEKRPRFVAAVSFDTANTDILYLTSHSDTATPDGATVISNVLRKLSGTSQKINPDKGNATIGGFNFSVVDKDKTVNNYIRDKQAFGRGLRHKQIIVYVGFEGMEWADYQPVLTYIIDKMTSKNAEIKFRCSDIQRKARQKIFKATERFLSKSVAATQTHIPVLTSDLTLFPVIAHDSSYTDRPNESVAYIELEDEIICHSGLFTHETDGVSFQVVTNGRGSLNTVAAEHVNDSSKASDRQPKIKEHVFIEGAAPKIVNALLTGNLEGQPGETLPDNLHLGISPDNVRLLDFTGIGSDVWDTATDKGRHVRIEGHKATDGKAFIEKEILFWLGAFMPVYSTGELGLKRLVPVLSNSGYLVQLDESNIVSYSDLTHDMKSVINEWDVKWNYVYQKDDYTKTTFLVDKDSIDQHQTSTKKEIKLRVVHTGAHIDEDIRSYFDTMRDRYSGPPLRLSVEVLPSLNWLEVGDPVRVKLDQISDFTVDTGETLDHVFEVQQVQMNWKTGKLKLDLFGSSQKAGTLRKTTLSSVLHDSFYPSEGTDLSTVLTVVGGSVTADGTLTGAALMKDAIYYYNGDLTIDSSAIAAITKNVELRIKGHLTINGKINGKGQGHIGGAGGTLWSNGQTSIYNPFPQQPFAKHNAELGIKGALGITTPCGDNGGYEGFTANPTIIGPSDLYNYNLVNRSTFIDGTPDDLIGTSGSGGGIIHGSVNATRTILVTGTPGGNSGAGLKIISRGMSFGPGGGIDLSGDDGVVNDGVHHGSQGYRTFGSPGAGGAAGGLAVFLDGNVTPPELSIYVTSRHGNSPYKGDRGKPFYDHQAKTVYSSLIGTEGRDMGESAYKLQYVPPSATAELETDSIAPNVTGFTSEINGENALLKWSGIISSRLSHFELRAGTNWATANPIAEVRLNYFNVQLFAAGTYNYLIKAIFEDEKESAVATLTTLNATAFIPSDSGATRNTGTLANADNVDFSSQVVGAAKPADNATNNTGALADLDAVTWGSPTILGQPAALVQTFYQSTAPTSGMNSGDYWIDSDDKKLYRYNGSSWLSVQDAEIQAALNDAATAQSTADGKIKTYFQTTAPTGMSASDVGDVWFDTNDNNKPYRYSGAAWVAADYDVATWSKLVSRPSDTDLLNTNTTWSQVAGTTNAPANNATVGATWGVNIGGSNLPANNADVTNTALQTGTTITGGGIILNSGGSLRSFGLTTEAVDVTAGVFIGRNGANYTFGVGDGNEKYIKYDGTDLVLGRDVKMVGASAYNNESIYYATFFESLDRYSSFGDVSLINNTLRLTSTTGDQAFTQLEIGSGLVTAQWGKNRKFKTRAQLFFHSNLGSGGASWLSTGTIKGVAATGFGFKMAWNSTTSKIDVYGVTGNLGTVTTTFIVALPDFSMVILEGNLIAGVNAVLSVDTGAAVSSITMTTNLPVGGTEASKLIFSEIDVAATSTAYINMAEYKMLQEP